ncbi:MAG: SDR family oxidoreductase [Bacteroidales bacterium]|nr:SDR family oxidoreductase [Bacteroidales bacterium]
MNLESSDLFCQDLPTAPRSDIGTVLVTGATGYIGGRLVPELVARGYRVRIMVRSYSPELEDRFPGTEIVVADALNVGDLGKALQGVEVAYYLIHSMLLGKKEFEIADIQAVTNLRLKAEELHIKRIIYLGGLGEYREDLSGHLRSRIIVAEILARSKIPTTILKAAIIIGSGSASYEIIENIVRVGPVLFFPSWSKTLCQPVSIRDIIKYLVGVLEIEETAGSSYDLCGDEILSYKDMIKTFAKLLGKKRLYLKSPISNIKVFSYIASLVTPVPAAIIYCLMEGVTNDVICKNNAIKKYLPFKTLDYKVAILRALSREEQDNISTRWSDAYPPAHELSIKLSELKEKPHYRSSYHVYTDKSAILLFSSICKVGGKDGWFHNNWMWRLRGFIDRMAMGVGSSRGRRSASTLRINDVIGFWRVEDLIPNKKLLLRAEMKLPGKAWLEFTINQVSQSDKNRLSVDAYFSPRGLLGNLYWYNFLPFHFIIFKNLLKQLIKRS